MPQHRWNASIPVWTVLAAIAMIAMPSGLAAQVQASTGIVRGTVTDTAGVPIDGATVTLVNKETNATRSLTTNTSGAYVATLLRVGTYQVSVRQLGFHPQSQEGVRVGLGEAAEVNFRLAAAAVQVQAITVAAEAPFIDPARVAAATKFDAGVVENLPNNGRNFLNLMLLTPNVAIVQGPDGDEISVAGQRGIHNNVSVDGADFNNPFFGEQRGGQRPAFTFNLDAVEEMVVVSQGASAEFGRSSGGFVNVITKSGTNEFHGSAHYFGKGNALSADYSHTFPGGTTTGFAPDFSQNQFGFTLGGPIVKDKAFFFVAYDQQVYRDTKQKNRGIIDPNFAVLRSFIDTAFSGALNGDFGAIKRTNDANALLAKIDVRLSQRNNLSLKYNYTNSRQQNGTFDVDLWGRSSNGLEKDYSHAVNGLLSSVLSNSTSNEFRFQYAREDRPRPYTGPNNPATGRPFPDTDISFAGYRIGMPFFLPITAYDTRVQLLDNISWSTGTHLFKAGVEWNRTEANQTFVGFGNGRMAFSSVNGFINYVNNGNGYVECADDATNTPTPSQTTGSCPVGQHITGPVVLYLQASGVGGLTVEQAGTQSIRQEEYAVFLQDSWKPQENLTVNYGLRWEAQINPDPITPPSSVFFAPFIGQTVTNATGTYTFPSDGTIKSDKKMWQPRLGISWDVNGDRTSIVRASAGLYYARLPGLNLASIRSTNGSLSQTIFRNSELTGVLGPPPNYGDLLPPAVGAPFQPGVNVMDVNFQNPRTFSATASYERELSPGLAASISYTHASTDHLSRFVDRNAAVFGSPWANGPSGLGTLTVLESTAKSRYNGFTLGFRRDLSRDLQFEVNYTLSYDKSDDDNERDPFSFRYARADSLQAEYNWSDRDQRHRLNAWVMARLPGDVFVNNRVSAYSAQPMSEQCGSNNRGNGQRAITPDQRICPDGHILKRNTLRKDNAFFSWDLRLSRPFAVGQNSMEVIFEVFNLLNTDNFRDPASGSLFLNFDGTIRSGLGEPRQAQAGLRYVF